VKEVVEQMGISELLVSISHCRTHATAFAVAVGKPRAERRTEP